MSYYDEIATGYNELHGEEQLKKLKLIHNYLTAHNLLSATDKILDVGCGTGLSAAVFQQQIEGVEPSKELAKQAPFPVTIAPAEQLPFPTKSVDVVLCVTVLHNFLEPETAVKEMKRVGKKVWVITILKKAVQAEELEALLRKNFRVQDVLDEEKDKIFVLTL